MSNVPAAEYLRAPTERQEYSLDCQSARIAKYAQENGLAVYQTYCDQARSGLKIARRSGLSSLLQDVVSTVTRGEVRTPDSSMAVITFGERPVF
jgi:hypothetical protein